MKMKHIMIALLVVTIGWVLYQWNEDQKEKESKRAIAQAAAEATAAAEAKAVVEARIAAEAKAKAEAEAQAEEAERVLAENIQRCRYSKGCKTNGLCMFHDITGKCIATDADCKKSNHCYIHGECASNDRRCVAESDAVCKKSLYCETSGRCIEKDGKCVATTASCKASPICKSSGRCTAVNGKCMATSKADCRRSVYCKNSGYCSLSGDGYCTSP